MTDILITPRPVAIHYCAYPFVGGFVSGPYRPVTVGTMGDERRSSLTKVDYGNVPWLLSKLGINDMGVNKNDANILQVGDRPTPAIAGVVGAGMGAGGDVGTGVAPARAGNYTGEDAWSVGAAGVMRADLAIRAGDRPTPAPLSLPLPSPHVYLSDGACATPPSPVPPPRHDCTTGPRLWIEGLHPAC